MMYKAPCTYCIAIPQTVLEVEEGEEIDSQYSQLDLFPEVGFGEFIMGDTLNEDEAMEEEEPMEVVMSQETTFSQLEFIPSDGSHSQEEASSSQETSITSSSSQPNRVVRKNWNNCCAFPRFVTLQSLQRTLSRLSIGSLSMQRFWATDRYRKCTVFLFCLSSHYHIYIFKSLCPSRDDYFENLRETNVLACKMFTSSCRPWLKNIACLTLSCPWSSPLMNIIIWR